MMENSANSQDKISRKEFYEFTAEQIDKENKLINFRLTWMIAIQGFLFTALLLITKILSDNPDVTDYNNFVDIIPIIGIIISGIGFLGVYGAFLAINSLKKKYTDCDYQKYPSPYGSIWAVRFGRLPCYGYPLVFLIIWILILVWCL